MSPPDVTSKYAATPKTKFSRKPTNTLRPRTICRPCRQKFSPRPAPRSMTKASPQRKPAHRPRDRSSVEDALRGGSTRVALFVFGLMAAGVLSGLLKQWEPHPPPATQMVVKTKGLRKKQFVSF